MKKIIIKLKLNRLGANTHVWFPAPPAKNKIIESFFDSKETKIQQENQYGNKTAYFFLSKKKLKIIAIFPLEKQPAISTSLSNFLLPNSFVRSDHPLIVKRAQALADKADSDEQKARSCFDWVVNYLDYKNPIRGLYSSQQALRDREVDCGGFATLLVALLRAINIPARCVFGWAIKSKSGYHAWIEHFDRGQRRWIASDPSVANLGSRTKLDAGFGYINDQRLTISVGEDIKLIGENISWPTPLLQTPITVSLDRNHLPVSFSETLAWKFA